MAELPPMPGQAAGATKVCPRCAESVLAAAAVCRFCGYDFQTMSAPPAPVKTNGLAIASLVLGIVWIYGIGAVLALVFGYQAKRQIDASNGREGGRGLAIAGIVLGWVGVGGVVLFLVVGLAFLSGPSHAMHGLVCRQVSCP